MDRSAFFASVRARTSGVFGTSLSQQQVAGIEGILDAFVTHGDGRDKTLAYALATAYHETGGKMVPVREGFAKDDATARRVVAKREYGKPAGRYGHVYYGRGQVQLTWLDNYRNSSKDAGYDLVAYPDQMLDPVISARVLIKGLLDGRWNARGKGIAFYLPDDGPDDLKNARRTVNVTDKWEILGGYYTAFLTAIKAAGGVPANDTVAAPVEERPVPKVPSPKPVAKSGRFWTWLFSGTGMGAMMLEKLNIVALDWRVQVLIFGSIIAFAIYAIATMPAVRNALGIK